MGTRARRTLAPSPRSRAGVGRRRPRTATAQEQLPTRPPPTRLSMARLRTPPGNSTVPGILAIQAKLDRATTANGDTLDIPPHPHKRGFGLKQDPPNHFVDHNISLSLSAKV